MVFVALPSKGSNVRFWVAMSPNIFIPRGKAPPSGTTTGYPPGRRYTDTIPERHLMNGDGVFRALTVSHSQLSTQVMNLVLLKHFRILHCTPRILRSKEATLNLDACMTLTWIERT